jgi:hypothetical protein
VFAREVLFLRMAIARQWRHSDEAGFFGFAVTIFKDYFQSMTAVENKFLKEAIKQGLRMQHRFVAEPVLARTGKGYLKSEGVETLQRIKAGLKKLI